MNTNTGTKREEVILNAFKELIPNMEKLEYFLKDHQLCDLLDNSSIESKLIYRAKKQFGLKDIKDFDLSLDSILSVNVKELELYYLTDSLPDIAFYVGNLTKVQLEVSDYQQSEKKVQIVEKYLPMALELNVTYIEFWS